jgi:hypothetical protein
MAMNEMKCLLFQLVEFTLAMAAYAVVEIATGNREYAAVAIVLWGISAIRAKQHVDEKP